MRTISEVDNLSRYSHWSRSMKQKQKQKQKHASASASASTPIHIEAEAWSRSRSTLEACFKRASASASWNKHVHFLVGVPEAKLCFSQSQASIVYAIFSRLHAIYPCALLDATSCDEHTDPRHRPYHPYDIIRILNVHRSPAQLQTWFSFYSSCTFSCLLAFL